jgi:hypothetical protein
MRPAASALLLAAALATGCARDEPTLSESDRQACETFAAHAASPGSDGYTRAFDLCVHNALHPERGGG